MQRVRPDDLRHAYGVRRAHAAHYPSPCGAEIAGVGNAHKVHRQHLKAAPACSYETECIRNAHDARCEDLRSARTSRTDADGKKQKFIKKRLSGGHVSIPRSWSRVAAAEEDDAFYINFFAAERCPSSYAAMLRSCSKFGSCVSGMLLHHHIIKDGFDGILLLQNLLVQMYSECTLLYDAGRLFHSIPFRDHFVWNFMTRACSQNEGSSKTTQMYDKMLGEGILPNKFCYTSLLLSYSSHEELVEGKRLLARLVSSSIDSDALLENVQLTMCCKCAADLDDAMRLFDMLRERNVVAWSAMIAAHGKQGKGDKALYFFKQMQQNGVLPNSPTFISVLDACVDQRLMFEGQCLHACFAGTDLEGELVLGTALVSMYGKHGELSRAWAVFDRMSEQNMVTWNGMITAYVLHSQGKDALMLFHQMLQQGIMPDKFILVSMFTAHATKEDLTDGKRMYSRLFNTDDLALDPVVLTAVLNMFCKCGSMSDAEEIFDNRRNPDVIMWSSMIAGYAQHGQSQKALELFKRMQLEGPSPTEATYTSVLSACSREGLVEEGVRHLLSMIRDHDMEPTLDHYNCVIDLLGRLGRLDEAEDLVASISSKDPNPVSWTTLLGACKKHADLKRGRRAVDSSLELGVVGSSSFVLLSDLATSC